MGAFMNKDSGIKENCGPDDIVIDVDGDDALIGSQTLNVINSIYSDDPDTWVLYSNFLRISDGVGHKGVSRKF